MIDADEELARLLSAQVREITGQRRNRIFRYGPYLALFQDDESPKAAAEA